MTILRKAEHEALRGITLSGNVLDLGGDARSEYRTCFSGVFSITTANLDDATMPDIRADLETSLPVADGSYDAVLLINVLEHIFEYRKLLSEAARVVKEGGMLVIAVPYMFPYHPSPHDFHRYSKAALEKALSVSGFREIRVIPLGSGVFAARWLFIERLLPRLFYPLTYVAQPLAGFCDALFTTLARMARKKYRPSDYALGFVAVARK